MKTAIQSGDALGLRRLLAENPGRANELIRWGPNCRIATHPLHYISDMLFEGTLQRGRELPLVEALLEAGADVNYFSRETPLIGAASLGAEDVGIRLLDAGARPEIRGSGGETALHWAAMLGEDRLVARLIQALQAIGGDLNLKDDQHHSPPLGWAIYGCYNPPAGNHGGQRRIAARLVAAGATVEREWLESTDVRGDPAMLAALQI